MKPIFADTFFFVALLNETDRAHAGAIEAARAPKNPWVTTAWVLAEVGGAMAKPINRPRFLELLAALRGDPQVTIVPPTAGLFDRGVALFADRPDKGWPLIDCISFVVMDEMSITDALTGDRHFEQAGFKALLK